MVQNKVKICCISSIHEANMVMHYVDVCSGVRTNGVPDENKLKDFFAGVRLL
jgi:phosphoribosylanthranilate isomerase